MKAKKISLNEFLIILFVLLFCVFNASRQFNFIYAFSFSGAIIVILTYLTIAVATHYIFQFLRNLIVKKQNKKFLMVFLLYFFYLLIVMLCINHFFEITGQNIHGDMSSIINKLKNFEFLSYQGWYSSIFYLIGFSIFPKILSNYAIVLLQIMVSSIFFTYVYLFLDKENNNISKIAWIFLNCIFPAAFFNQFCLRQLWFAQMIIVLAIQILNVKMKEHQNKEYIKILLLTAFVALLRPEAVVFIPFVLLFLVFLNKNLTLKIKIIYTLILIFSFLILRIPQKDLNEYKSTALLNPLSYLVSYEDLDWGGGIDAKDNGIEIINKVFDYEALKENSSYTSLVLPNKDPSAWKRNFSNEDFSALTKLYLKLILHNPVKWLQGRWLTFSISYSNKGWMSYQTFFDKFTKNSIINFILHLVYSPILFLIINFIAIIYYIFKKNMIKSVVSSFGIIQSILIFIFGTSSVYMFIYPIWFISGFISICFLKDFLKERKKKI